MPAEDMTQEERELKRQQDLDLTQMIRPWDISEIANEVRVMCPDIQLSYDTFVANHPFLDDYGAAYLAELRRMTGLGRFGDAWIDSPGYLVPASTGPWWVVGPPELVTEAVGKSSLAIILGNGLLAAIRPQGVALPDGSPRRWWRLLGAMQRGRAGLLWVPPSGYGD